MKYAITMLLACVGMVGSASAELIIVTDTTLDFIYPPQNGPIQIFDGPVAPTTVEVVDGAVIGGNIHVRGSSVLNHRGGITAGVIIGHDNSTVNIFDGIVADGEDVTMFDDSVANIYGGHFGDDIRANDSATVNLYGGTFVKDGTGASLVARVDGVINVHLREYEFAEDGFHLSGILLDGSEFKEIWVGVDPFDLRTARIVLHTIPEPSALALAITMGLVLIFFASTRRNRSVRSTGPAVMFGITLLFVSCCSVSPASAELIIVSDTTIDFHVMRGETVQIYDGPNSPTTVEIVEGARVSPSINVWGHSVLNMRGGITHSFVFGRDHSTINIFGGDVATGEDISMFDDSVANIYGGHFGDDIRADGSATVNLYGGTFELQRTGASLAIRDNGVINVYLREYEVLPPPSPGSQERLIGVLSDGSEIDLILNVDPDLMRDARFVFHTVIPEPDSITLAFIVGLILGFHALTRRNRRVRRTGRGDHNSISKSGICAMKYAITMLLVGCWIVAPVSAEIITMDTTLDSLHTGGTIEIYDGPDSPTTVEVVDGAIIGVNIHVRGNSELNLRGGITASFILGHDNSTINIFGGEVAQGEDIEMDDNSVANIYGGHFGDDIEANGSATVNLYGGTFELQGIGATLQVQGDGVINVFLREFDIVIDDQGRDLLGGVLFDGSEIDEIWLRVDSFELRNARIVLHTIPEPDSVTLAFMTAVFFGFHVLMRRNRGARRTSLH